MTQELKQAVQRRGVFAQTVKAVFWSFFGVRRNAHFAEDMAKLNPLHVVIAGVVGAVVFVVALLLLVRWVVASNVAV